MPEKRKIVQLETDRDGDIFVLLEDGTLWEFIHKSDSLIDCNQWYKIPGPDEVPADRRFE